MKRNGRIGSSCQNNGSMYVLMEMCGILYGCTAMKILHYESETVAKPVIQLQYSYTSELIDQPVLESNMFYVKKINGVSLAAG